MVGKSRIAKRINLNFNLNLNLQTMRTLVYLSFAYGFSELLLMFIKRSKQATVKTRQDRGSLIFLWAMITIGFSAGFSLSNPVNQFWAGFGYPLIIAGLIIRWVAILQLGNSFTVDVAINNTASLKTDGIYERIRHPSYSGLLLVIAGFSATMNSIYSFLVLEIPVLIAVIYRVSVEEKVLMNEFGAAYSEYKSRTKKLIPGIY
jgi:protein-S-isoprenylcysteine O-methyltransferase Ste14